MRFAFLRFAACAVLLPCAALAQSPPPASWSAPGKGPCAACHQLAETVQPNGRSDLGPRLEGTRMRELGRERIREAIVDPTRANPDTVMPPYGRHRILDAREIDQLVEFLHALP